MKQSWERPSSGEMESVKGGEVEAVKAGENMPQQEEIDRLRRENTGLLSDRRRNDEEWHRSDSTWKEKIGITLSAIHSDVQLTKLQVASTNKALDSVQSQADQTDLILRGNPATSSPGLILDIDRLKTSEKAQTWWIRAIAGAGLTAAAAWVADHFGGKKP